MRPINWVRVERFAELTGYSKGAVYQKIYKGVWKAGIHYREAPDGHKMMNLEAYEKWVEQEQAA